jgi:pimeloyl-ACP methyl ester carboxylesterase
VDRHLVIASDSRAVLRLRDRNLQRSDYSRGKQCPKPKGRIMKSTSNKQIGSHLGRWLAGAALSLAMTCAAMAQSPAKVSGKAAAELADVVLVRALPGFRNGYADVNGIRLHYVEGGKGATLVLLPGWPETWWEFHKIIPTLASHYHVIAVDLRGMGGSSRPQGGYDKKNMAEDIYQLVRLLGHEKINIAGHDIGSMVAFSFAANHPEATLKVALLDVPHPDESMMEIRMLPDVGTFGAKIDDEHPGYTWWFAFHQVKGLPETILQGRFAIYQNFLIDYLSKDSSSIGPRDRAIYAAAYSSRDAIRAGDAWYQTFSQDVLDSKTYKKLEMPVLGLGGPGYGWLKVAVTPKVENFRLVKVENSGHFIQEEQPEIVEKLFIDFFG